MQSFAAGSLKSQAGSITTIARHDTDNDDVEIIKLSQTDQLHLSTVDDELHQSHGAAVSQGHGIDT